jgi:SsrA-binding protein
MAKKASNSKNEQGPATIRNRRAGFDYEFLQTFEAGVVLIGSEVKSVFKGKANLTDAYCTVKNGEMWLISSDIEPYDHSSYFQPERRRDRKLLLHSKEISLIDRRSMEKGLTIVPTKMYFTRGKVKVEIALARGKRSYDKRESIAKKETRREADRLRSSKDF